jgi:hypothetical protein
MPDCRRGEAKPLTDPNIDNREELLRHLEELTGRSFHSRDDVRHYVDEMRRQEFELLARKGHLWSTVKQSALLALFVVAFLQYYFVDTLYQISTLQQVQVFVPVRALLTKS